MRHNCSPFLFLLLASMGISGFSQESIRANVRGDNRSDRGKCTIEADVDSVAEVEIRGDTARIRTLAGQPSTLRRFDCDGIIPSRPADFRFKGIDGRGRMTLVQDPRNGGFAVVRIEDPKGGREGYTFDLEWQGGSGSGQYSNDQYQNQRRGDGGYDRRGDGDRRRFGERNQDTFVVTCSSENGRRQYCEADIRNSVRLKRQFSRAACRQNETWGYDGRGIWVDRGCGADFEVSR